jgi:flagellar protein FlaF
LRAQIISLALWVSKYSSDVLRNGAAIDPLIDINRTMMEGLATR